MENQSVLLFDQDQVAADLHAAWLHVMEQRLGIQMTKADIVQWDTLGPYVDLLQATEDIYDFVAPIPGAIEVMQRLVTAGYEVEVVTASLDEHVKGKRAWFHRHMPFLHNDAIHFSHRKQRFASQGILFDDAAHNIEAFRKAGGQAVVFDQIYNRQLAGPRVVDWFDLERWVLANVPAPASA